MSPRDVEQRLIDIIEAIDAIDALEPDEQAAIRYHLIVIGEAAASLDDSVRSAHPSVPWVSVVGLRNELVHAYHRTDIAKIQRVVASSLSDLRRACEALLEER